MCWYQCPANNYITHYHVLEPITVNLKLHHRNSSTSAESTQHECTSLWPTLPKHQQYSRKTPNWRIHWTPHLRHLKQRVGALQLTNATSQKVSHLSLNSTSGTHRHTQRGSQGHRGYVRYIHVECDRLGAPTVNHIYYVHLRWGYVYRGVGGLLWLGIWVDSGGWMGKV